MGRDCDNCRNGLSRQYEAFERGHTREEMQTGGLLDPIVGTGDYLLGGIDEAVGGAVDEALEGDFVQSGDELLGGLDEGASQVIDESLEGDIFGAGDVLLGGVDEAATEALGGLARLDPKRFLSGVMGGAWTHTENTDAPSGNKGVDTINERPNRDFDRNGTPTTDDGNGGGSGEDSEKDGNGNIVPGVPNKALAAGGAAIGALILLGGDDDDGGRTVPGNTATGRNIPGPSNNQR